MRKKVRNVKPVKRALEKKPKFDLMKQAVDMDLPPAMPAGRAAAAKARKMNK